jgi:hypothetical protein
MCLAYTWRVPPMYPGGSGRQLRLPGGKVQPGRSSNQVSVRRPRLADSHPPARGSGHLPRHPQMPAAAARPGPAVSDLDPDHAVCSPDRDHAPLPRSARAAVPDAVPGQLAHQQRGVIPAQVPRAEHPDRERAGDPRPLRPPVIVALSRTALAISAPALPRQPRGEPPGRRADAPVHAQLGGPRQA